MRSVLALFLLCLPHLATAAAVPLTNPSFEAVVEHDDGRETLDGWTMGPNGYRLSLDDDIRFTGNKSVRIRWAEGARSAFVSQRLDLEAVRGRWVRFGGFLRSDGLDGRLSSLFLRIDGEGGILRNDFADRPDPRGTTPWTRFEIVAPVPEDATQAFVGVWMASEGTLWADALYLEVLDAEPSDEIGPLAQTYLGGALDLMQERSIVADEVDWDALRSSSFAAARGARFPDELYGVLRGALNRLGDAHSNFLTPAEVQRLRVQRPASGEAEQSTPSSRMLDRVAHVRVPPILRGERETQREYASILQTLIVRAEDADACGYIVDLRSNSGGVPWPMLLGLAPLFGDGLLGAYVDAQGERAAWVLEGGLLTSGGEDVLSLGLPQRAVATRAPVAVLTSRNTASSAEAVAAAFKGRRASRSFGTVTRGLSTGRRGYALADGAQMNLTTLAVMDREGRTYGDEIPVDETVEGSADAVTGEDPVIEAARAWLARQHGC